MTDLQLTAVTYGTLAPDQVNHQLTDDGWSSFDFGPYRVQVPRDDLTRIRAARVLARTITAQAAFWDKDLAQLEAELEAAEAKKEADTPAADPSADTTGIGELPENQERAFQKFEADHATQPPAPPIEEDLPDGDTGKRPARRRARSA